MARFSLEDTPALLAPIAALYQKRVRRHGASPAGVYWRHQFGQYLRFDLLLGLLTDAERKRGGLVVNDLGCGYGAFFDFLRHRDELRDGRYLGYDICPAMIDTARQRIHDPRARFERSAVALWVADVSLVSGTFNMKLEADDATWNAYVKESLRHLWTRSRLGLAFNMLDVRGCRDDTGLYYADAGDFMDFCAGELSPDVRLVDNAPLEEWTILVRRA